MNYNHPDLTQLVLYRSDLCKWVVDSSIFTLLFAVWCKVEPNPRFLEDLLEAADGKGVILACEVKHSHS